MLPRPELPVAIGFLPLPRSYHAYLKDLHTTWSRKARGRRDEKISVGEYFSFGTKSPMILHCVPQMLCRSFHSRYTGHACHDTAKHFQRVMAFSYEAYHSILNRRKLCKRPCVRSAETSLFLFVFTEEPLTRVGHLDIE